MPPLQINHNCCYKCGDLLDDIFCQQCTCKSCGNGAHIGYNCPPKAPIISNPEQCNQTINELLQTLPSVHPTCNYEDENSFTYDSKPNSFNDSPSVLTHPPQLYSRLSMKGAWKSTRKKETAAQSFIPYWNSSMIDDEEARDNFLKDVCTFLRKFSRIPFGVTPNVILIAWESFGEIKDALMDKQLSDNGLLRIDDVKSLKMCELSVKSVQNRLIVQVDLIPLFYFDDVDDEYTIIWRGIKLGITPDLVQIPSGSKGVSDDIYDHSDAESLLSQDIPITSPKIDFLSEEFAGEFAPIPPGMDEDKFDEEEVDYYDHDISSDDDSYENIEYPSQGGLNCVVISDNSNDPLLELPEFESFHFDFDPSFPRPPPEPSDVEISLIIETDAHVINDFGELNEDECFDPGGGTDKAKITRKQVKTGQTRTREQKSTQKAGRKLSNEEELDENDDVLGEEEFKGDHFDKFPTRSKLAYHKYLMSALLPSIIVTNLIIAEGNPLNIKIMTTPLEPRSPSEINNFTGRVRGMHIFIGNFTYVSYFMIVEDISSVIDPRMSLVVLGKPFVGLGLDYDDKNTLFGMYKWVLKIGLNA
ncbi:hypothetical protein Tco_0337433 [Tanacetum coccineum]